MGDELTSQSAKKETFFSREIGAKAARKLRMQRQGGPGVWFGLGMSGLIGWSVTVPTLVGAMLGLWLDRRHPGPHSWTLMLLVVGLVIGCANAWHWVDQQIRAMQDKPEDKDE
ncbi:MAG: AtpZ/AtpI family protein [Candidatus Acidiferrales bacterium]|jgi:ATP synthase protein I